MDCSAHVELQQTAAVVRMANWTKLNIVQPNPNPNAEQQICKDNKSCPASWTVPKQCQKIVNDTEFNLLPSIKDSA